jgi:phosphatidylserine/phosphatidylglycerophosphate/cardiolipin synthase-like enzyme
VIDTPRNGKKARRVLRKGVTCWRIARADRVGILIDGAAYYLALLRAFRQARSRIMILGWDFDPGIRLDPSDPATELRRLLSELVERHPDLNVHLLIWDVSLVFGPSRTLEQAFDDWQAHPRIHFRLDGQHPFVAAHHEKIVCIDDALAFVGGIDLTIKRWDTPAHDPRDPRRVDAHDGRYDAVHDLQMAIDGEAAQAVAELARARWADATGEYLARCGAGNDPWPASLTPWLTGVPVGIARTRPGSDGMPAVREVAALNAAALAVPGARSTSRRSTSARGRLPTAWRRCWSGRTGRKSSSWSGGRRPAGWNVSPWAAIATACCAA